MADQFSASGDAVQTGESTFTIDGSQSGDLMLPENLSAADADFSVEGGDLVMSFPDGTTVTVEDYYANENPPTFVSQDGAEVGSDVVTALTSGSGEGGAPTEGAFGFVEPEAAEAIQAAEISGNIADNPNVIAGTDGEPIGNVESLSGEVYAIRVDGSRVRLDLGDEVYQGDILETGPDGNAGILLADETTFAMGPEGRMVLDEMVYDPATQEGSVSMSVLQGVFTFVSGQVAKTDPDAMTLDTPVATIGIRGTQVGLDLTDGNNLNVHLMEERFGFVGEVVVANDGGVQVLNDANAFTTVSSFDTPPSDFVIVTVEDILASYGEETLPYLPTRNQDGERTSANTYREEGEEVEGENRESLDFLDEFQTDAGGLDEFDEDFTGVLGGNNPGLGLFGGPTTPFTATVATQPTAATDPTDPTGSTQSNDPTDPTDVTEPPDSRLEVLREAGLSNPDISPNEVATGIVEGDFDGTDPRLDGLSYNISGTGADNRIVTGDENDIIGGGAGNDDITANAGNDRISGGEGNDRVDGGAGDDFVFGDAGDDIVIGGDGNDSVSGGDGDDEIYGDAGDDTLSDGDGADYVAGGDGDDFFIVADDGEDDVFIGGAGEDTISFEEFSEGLTIDLSAGAATSGDGVVDSISEIENVVGSSGDDIIVGDEFDNVLVGAGGDDVIDGREGQDTVSFSGARGESTFSITNGVLTVTGPDGTDTIENVENFVFDDTGSLTVGLEDTAISVDVVAGIPSAESATSIVVTGVPDGALLSAGEIQADGSWLLSASELDGLTVTGAENSDADFSLTFTTYDVDYEAAITSAAEQYLATQLDPETGEPLQTLEEFKADGGSVIELATGDAAQFMPSATASGSQSIEVIAVVDPFSISVGGIDLTADGTTSPIVFAGTEDKPVDLNILASLTDTDGSEVMTVTIGGLPTLEVVQVSNQVPVLDEFGEPVLDENGEPVTETVTSYEPLTDASGNPVGAHLTYVDANGETIVLPANDTGTYTLTTDQLNKLSLVGSPDDSGTMNLSIEAVVQDGTDSTSTVFGSAIVELAADADVPTVSGGAEAGVEDQPVRINFDIDKTDVSEHITDITLTGIPDGASLAIEYADPDTGEVMTVQLVVIDGSADIPLGFLGDDMSTDGLILTPPAYVSGDFNLQLQVTSTEPTNGDTETNNFDIPLNIAAVANELDVTINGESMNDGGAVAINTTEEGTFSLDISAITEDVDGSEVISVTISGVPDGAVLSTGTDIGNGTWTLTAAEFTDLSITPPVDSDENFDLTVTVTNVDNNEDTISLEATVSVDVEAVADAANLSVSDATGVEDTPIALEIASSLKDNDGSETLSITIEGVPDGAILSAGTDNQNGTWTLSPDELDGLTITPGQHVSGEFALTVTATTTEGANLDQASVTQEIGLTVIPDPDAPVVNVTSIVGNEDTAIPLNIDAALVDQDGSETLSISISGVPDGATLSAGTNLGNGMWEVDPADLAALTITPPADSNDDFNLTVTATSTESNGEFAETTAEIPVTLLGVADDPALVTEEVVGFEDTAIALNISASLNDTDGSEGIGITISEIPKGAILKVGDDQVGVKDGVTDRSLTIEELANLTITPPLGSDEDFTLHVTATSTEDDNDVTANGQGVSSVSGTIDVVVQEQADPPALMLFDASGNEDQPVPLNIAAILTDPEETLSVTVTGLPDGVTLSAGTQNEDGSWDLAAGDLAGLTMNLLENSAHDFQVQVEATSTTDDGTFATTSGSMNVSIAGVADEANLATSDVTADEGTTVPLSIDVSLNDTDGSETLSITIANMPDGATLTAGTQNDDGTWTLTPEQLDGLGLVTPQGMDDDFTLLVTATTTEDDAAQTANGQGVSSVSGVINVDMTAVAETPTLTLQDASGNEDQPISLDISAFVTDASETVSITISGVPDGAMLSAGSNNNDGTWTLSQAQLEGLTITPPADSNENFQLEVTATSTEEDGTSASTSGSLSIGVTGVADAPTLTTGDSAGSEDSAIALNIAANLNDTDGSETLSITIAGVPAGASLSAGAPNSDGTWTLSGADLDGLTLTPPADASGSITLAVSATSTENDGDSSTVVGSINIDVEAVADAPTLILHDAAGFEDDAIPLEIAAAAEGGDDIVSIVIGNVPSGAVLSAGTDNGDGTWTLTAAQLDDLSITPPENSNENFNLNVTVTSQDGDDLADTTQALNVSVTAVADKPNLSVPSQVQVEGDDAVDLDIMSSLNDLDGSESLSITVSNIPDGATLSIGDDILTVVDGSIDLSPDQLGGLQVTAPEGFEGNFTLQVTATATDTDPDDTIPEGLETNVSIGFIDVDVSLPFNDPDAPNLNVDDAQGFEDSPIALDIETSLVDPSEVLSVTISGVPAGASLSAGTDLGNGVWSLLPEEVAGLTVTPPADSNVDFNLQITATSTTEEGDYATSTATLPVDVVGVADAPNLQGDAGDAVIVDGGLEFPLDIASSLNDVDGSETLSLTVSGLPDGVTLSAGTPNDDGTWTVRPEQLDGLSMTVPNGVNPDFDFDVTATATENDGDTASVSTTIEVEGDNTAETPELSVSAAAGDEDTAIALDIQAALTDTDGSEVLSITVAGLPNGAVLSAGTVNPDGSVTLSPDELSGLTVTPPEDSDGDFSLSVSATSRELASGDTNTVTVQLPVTVTAVADVPDVAAGDADGDVGQIVAFDIQSVLSDTDGSETLSITVAGFPDGASLNAGTDNGDGSYTLSAADLDGLAISLPDGASDDFDLTVTATATEGSNLDTASSTVQAVVNVDPLANDDRNVVEVGAVTEGNVLTGEGDTTDPSAGADVGSAVDNAIVDVTFGGTTKSFDNPDDVQSDADGSFIEIEGDHGTLKMYADGSYDYAADDAGGTELVVAGLTGQASGSAVQEAWSSVDTFAFDFGTSFVDADGKLDPALADADVSFNPQGVGVEGTQNGMPVPDQINHDDTTGESQALGIDLGGETTSVTLSVSRMFQNEDGGEQGAWQAFDADGNLVGEGILNAQTVDYGNSSNVGSADIALPGGEAFQYIVFTAIDTVNSNQAGDSSDFFIRALEFEVGSEPTGEDAFTYTMQDADGDTASATLTIDVEEEQDRTASDPKLAVEDAAGFEDGAIALDIAAGLTDLDGSETLSITIDGVPNGATLSAGTQNDDGTWTVAPDELDGLTVTPPTDSDEDFTLQVTATSTEASTGDTATQTATIEVAVDAVADATTVNATVSTAIVTPEPGTPTNLAVNGSFEDVDISGQWEVFADGELPGWRTDMGPGIEVQSDSLFQGDAADGGQYIELDSHGGADTNSNAFQMLPTGGGDTFVLSFDYSPRPGVGEGSNTIEVLWGGEVIETISGSGSGALDWNSYSFELPSGGDLTRLEFRAAGADDSLGGLIDNVSVVDAAEIDPEPHVEVSVDVTATFGDFIDGSEEHFVFVEMPEGWEAAPGTGEVVDSTTVPELPEGANFLRVEVSGDAIAAGNGTVSVPVSFVAPTDAVTENVDLDIFAAAIEQNLSGDEITTANNWSFSETSITVDAQDTDASDPTLSVDNAAGFEDGAIALDITAGLTDIDGSETLSITIGGVPTGATLSAGTQNDDGTWTVAPDDLDGLTVTPPSDSNEDFTLQVTATSTESSTGDTATQTATVNVAVTGVADAPALSATIGDPTEIPGTSSITITNMGQESAGYENTYGYYVKDADGNPTEGVVIWPNTKEDIGDTFTLEGVDPESIGFFVIPNGDTENDGIMSEMAVTFRQDDSGNWHAVGPDGNDLDGSRDPVLFNDPALNENNFDYTTDNQVVGNQNWEDLAGGGDRDFNDVNINVETSPDVGSGTVSYPLSISSSLTDTDGSETLSITVGNLPDGASLSSGAQNQDGSWNLTPAQLSGLVVTVVAGTDDFDLSVVATSTENDGDTNSVSTSVSVDVPDVDDEASTPELAATDAAGFEDSGIALDISAALGDTDGSETLSITISNVPAGASLNAGTENADGTWTLTPEQLTGLEVTPPNDSNVDFALTVTATATESNGGATATTTATVPVSVTGVADQPTLSLTVGDPVESTVGGGDPIDVSITTENVLETGSGFSVAARSINQDGSLSDPSADNISFNASPVGFGVSGSASGANSELGYDSGDGVSEEIVVDFDEPISSVDVAFAWMHSGEQGTYELFSDGVKVGEGTVTGITDAVDPSLTFTADGGVSFDRIVFSAPGSGDDYLINAIDFTIANEGDPVLEYPLDIASSLTDTDGSETLSVTVSDLPEGATLSAGTENANGSWTLTPAQLLGLTLTVAAGSEAFALEVTALSTENDGDTASVTTTVDIEVPESDNTASDPSLSVADVTGNEDSAITLDIAAGLTDVDGSESLSITVSGVPNGATLSAGTETSNGVWELTSAQLDGLTITPPADSNEDFDLTVTATSTEENGGATADVSQTFTVDVVGVADAPNVSASASLAEGHGSAAEGGSSAGSDSGSGSGSGSGSDIGEDLIAFHEIADGDGSITEPSDHFDADLKGVTLDVDGTGPSGSSLVFDGNNDYIEVGHDDDMELSSGTFVLWFNTEDAESKQGLFSKDSSGYDDGGHVTAWVDDGQLEVRLQSSSNSFMVQGGDVTSGAWHQMAFSFGPDGMKLYMDGQLIDSDSYTGGIGSNEEPIVFGANQWVSGNEVANNLRDYFVGQMDGVAIYDRALTPTEMVNLYDEGAAQMDGGDAGTIVYDLDIDGSLVDVDGSESLSFEVRGLPDGVVLSAGSDDGNGTWALTAAQLEGLTLEIDADVSDDFSIDVVAITAENDGDTAESVVQLDIDVSLDAPVSITGTSGKDTLEGGSGDDQLFGSHDNDKLYGFAGDDILDGGNGHDSLFGDIGDDVMSGGHQNDSLIGGDGNDQLDGGTGNDKLWGDAGDDVLVGGHGKDQLDGGTGNDSLDGGTGKDTLDGGEGDDVLIGGSDKDKLFGGDGDDTIDAGDGNDSIAGGAGDDIMTGGWGNDTFKVEGGGGHDIIQDIMEQDTIVFEGQEFHADDMIFNENEDGDVVVSFNGVEGQSVTLNGVSMDDLDHNNDGDMSEGYSVSESDGKVTLTIDSQ